MSECIRGHQDWRLGGDGKRYCRRCEAQRQAERRRRRRAAAAAGPPTDERWRMRAACRYGPAGWWDVDSSRAAHRQAVAVCHGCPVRAPCRGYADKYAASGVWGGVLLVEGQALTRQPSSLPDIMDSMRAGHG